MQTQKRLGMQLLDDHLIELVQAGTISRDVAMDAAQLPSDFGTRLGGS